MHRYLFTKASFFLLSLLLAAVMLSCFPRILAAEEIEPEKVRVSTPLYRPNHSEFDPPRGTYRYSVSWEGIPAASAVVKVNDDGLRYHISAFAKTYSAIDIFYRLRYRADGILSISDLLPERTVIDQRENSRVKTTEMDFQDDGSIKTVRFTKGKGTSELTFNPENFTLDPFSAAFISRSLDWNLGETKVLDTFNGRARYLIYFTAEDKVKFIVNGQERDVWVISPRVEKLTDLDGVSKLREAKIYVTADKARDVLQIVSSVFVGSVTTELESFEPAVPVGGTQVAENNKVHFMLK